MAHGRHVQLRCRKRGEIVAKKNIQSSAYWRQLTSDSWFHFYRQSLTHLVTQMFEWKGLPETVNPFFLESALHKHGHIAFIEDSRYKHMCVVGAPMHLNPYGDPVNFRANMYQFFAEFDLYSHLIPIETAKEEKMGVLCRNQVNSFTSSEQAIYMFSALLAENKQTKLISQNALKIPYVFKGKPEQVLSIKNIFEKIQANEPLIIEDEENSVLDNFSVLQTGAPYHLDKLDEDRSVIYNEFLTHFGINNVNITKAERLVTSEADSNNELILHNRNKFLAPREETAKILSLLWDKEITVGLRDNLTLESQLETKSTEPKNEVKAIG